jgi:hypothetical protein
MTINSSIKVKPSLAKSSLRQAMVPAEVPINAKLCSCLGGYSCLVTTQILLAQALAGRTSDRGLPKNAY